MEDWRRCSGGGRGRVGAGEEDKGESGGEGEGKEEKGEGRRSNIFSTIILGLTIEEERVGRGGGKENEEDVEDR